MSHPQTTTPRVGTSDTHRIHSSRTLIECVLCVWTSWVILGLSAMAGEPGNAARGYELLINKAYLPPDFDQETFDNVWRAWPQPLRSRAEAASTEQRRQMAFDRYGLDVRSNDPARRPLQYVVDSDGNWSMNCLACHGGSLDGRVYPGLPNARYGLQTLTEDMRTVKIQLKKPLTNIDLGSLVMPLGTSVGTTNAVMFGVVLLAKRDADLNLLSVGRRPQIAHHDMDAPAWWHFKRKSHIYIDGFAPKGHRGLMQFLLVKHNGPEKFREWEADFRHIRAYLESLQPPTYPFDIDQPLAARGLQAFRRVCSRCHGTYGEKPEWPEVVVPIDEIGTDRVRLDSISRNHRQQYAQSWFTDYGRQPTVIEPKGYVAPPLDGIWASAPYLHNGSVPTLWHLLHPKQRPVIWKRNAGSVDTDRVGLRIDSHREIPKSVTHPAERRRFFDTRQPGKSNAGHLFPNALTPAERRAVLEYLKTL